MTDTKKMTDEQVFALAAASDLLREYGYETVADVVGRISDQELVIQHSDGQPLKVTRLPYPVVEFDSLVEWAKRIVDATEGDVAVTRAVTDLLAAFRPDEREQIAAFLRRN